MGSGHLIKRSIKKYGLDNFTKEYLGIYDVEWKMNLAERIYVVLDSEVSYNICSGGKGGFNYINSNGLNVYKNHKKIAINNFKNGKDIQCNLIRTNDSHRKKCNKKNSETHIEYFKTHEAFFKGMKHTEETKEKMRKNNKKVTGEKNGSFGTCWIYNETENKKIKKEYLDYFLSLGYIKGRKMKV